jgi:hypothetical protein
VKHFTTPGFWSHYHSLPESIQKLADKNFHLLKTNIDHPSLRFKKTGIFWSARVGSDYRVLGKSRNEGILWLWIGPHSEYDKFLKLR